MRDLILKHDDNGTFLDFSLEAADYLRDDTAITFVALDDAIYIGLYKQFNAAYVELLVASIAGNTLTYEYSKTASFSALSVRDDSKNFSRNGFIQWDKPDDWEAQSIDGDSKFWIKITSDIDFDATIRGLNLVFADDNDLAKEQRNISDLLSKGDTSFIAYQVAARDEIIQSLRNSGYTTRLTGNNAQNDLTQWDLLDFTQVRNAAKFLCLSKIMFDVSTNSDDKWYQRFRDYQSQHADAFKLYLLWLDRDDNGKAEAEEKNFFRSIQLVKV